MTRERSLYSLLPAIYRVLDEARAEREHGAGRELEDFLAVIERNLAGLHDDVGRLYDDAFIETCEPWVIPYIGDLVAVPMLHAGSVETFSLRTFVANTLAYRRRKGTAAILGNVARDLTGWPALAREYFQLSGWTQNVNALASGSLRMPDLRDIDRLTCLGGPFEDATYAVDVSPNRSNAARYNPANVGVFLWRLASYPLEGATAAVGREPWQYTFSSLGYDEPLFNRPLTQAGGGPPQEANLPAPLRRLPLYEDLIVLRERRGIRLPNQPLPAEFDAARSGASSYFSIPPVFAIRADQKQYAPAEILIADLSAWGRLSGRYRDYVAVDPELGRIAFPQGVEPRQVVVDYSYGFGADVGAGTYRRDVPLEQALGGTPDWQVGVSSTAAAADIVRTISEALARWRDHVQSHPDAIGLIVVMDSATYIEDLVGQHAIAAPGGSALAIVAATWPVGDEDVRTTGAFDPDGVRPHLRGAIEISSPPDGAGHLGVGAVLVDGLLVEGQVRVGADMPKSVMISHCTVVPARGAIVAGGAATKTALTLRRVISGPVTAGPGVTSLRIEASVIDGGGNVALVAPHGDVAVTRSTVLGNTKVFALEAMDTIFAHFVSVVRQQRGRMSFCYVPANSRTPRRFRCQPDLALSKLTDADAARRRDVELRLTPAFASRRYGTPLFAMLAAATDPGIAGGAGDGSEMGVFGVLRQAQRRDNLDNAFGGYLRLALTAGFSAAT